MQIGKEQRVSTNTAQADVEAQWGEWMAAAQDGDAAAYRKLLESILPPLRRLVRARLSDATLSEDVVQDTLLHIHRARHTYRPERPFGPWMRTIARNAVIDALRERGRRGDREVMVEALESLPQAATMPDLDAADERLSPRLRAALDALSPGQRQAVELIHLRGLSVAAAAAQAGVSPGALKVRAHRGYRALRAQLGGGRG